MITSGIRPYNFQAGFPFSASGARAIGFSGILFEEAMFVITAEKDIYVAQTGINRKFTKYINKGAGITSLFEPANDGSNLDSSNTNPGCVQFKDYILDMRNNLSGLLLLMQMDSEFNAQELLVDYFKRYHGNNPSGSVGNWLHSAGELGYSGLYDIDLREVQFQPFIRSGPYVEGSGLFINMPVGPIFPTFCSKVGDLPHTSDRDIAHVLNMHNHLLNHLFDGILASGYVQAQLDKFFILGDIFQSAKSQAYLTFDINDSFKLKSSSTALCNTVFDRNCNQKLTGGAGSFDKASFSVGSGLYQIYLNQNAVTNPYSAVSGDAGFWPPISKIFGGTSGVLVRTLNNASDDIWFSGFHIFNDGFWGATASGARLFSPINGKVLWHRFADQQEFSTSNSGPHQWSTISHAAADPIISSNDKLVFFLGNTSDLNPDPVLADRRFIFAKYDPDTLDFISSHETPGTFASPTSPPSINRFWYCHDHVPISGGNASNLYILSEVAALSSGPETYFVDTSFNNRGAMESNLNSPICLINQHLYSYLTVSNPSFSWNHILIDNTSSFPSPAGSGHTTIASSFVYESRPTKFAQEIVNYFEPISSSGFSFGGLPNTLDPRGSELDIGDGSILVRFNAKMKNSTVLRPYWGRIKESTSGTLDIFEFWLFENTGLSWIYPFS